MDWVESGCETLNLLRLDTLKSLGMRPFVEVSYSPDEWQSDHEEVQRLGRCHLNVWHYHSAYAGQSAGVTMGIAARRPLLINSNRMLRTLHQFSGYTTLEDELLGRVEVMPQLYRVEEAVKGIQMILYDIEDGREILPTWLAKNFAWSKRIHLLGRWWRGLKES